MRASRAGPDGFRVEGSHINQFFHIPRAIAATGLSDAVPEPPLRPP